MLPLLPGYTLNPHIGRNDFLKAQHFTVENKLPTERELDVPRFPKLHCHAQKFAKFSDHKPAWESFSNRVLCFDAFFEEPIYRISQTETHRYRICKIYYYLEDDTMQIVEPAQDNSAICQGTIVKRHRFKKPGEEESFYTFNDFNVDITLEIYSHLYRITNCDKFTKSFLAEMGINVKEPISKPWVPFGENIMEVKKKHEENKGCIKIDTLGPYLRYHPLNLRFFCIWDDQHNLHGVTRKMVLYYFVSDKTIQIVEDRPENTGRTETKVFWKKSPLPKEVEDMPVLGEITNTTVLNMSGLKGNAHQYNVDRNPLQGREIASYTDVDLDLGITINVMGRKFFIYDCDAFTKKYYRDKYQRELIPVKIPDELTLVEKREIFPVSGFGSLEDSMQNCFQLRPKPQKKDLTKFYVKDRYGFDPGQLMFSASIIDDDLRKPRHFVITYFLSDDTISVFEQYEENSGRSHGPFMIRKRAAKPGQSNVKLLSCYELEDMFVGNSLTLSGQNFILNGADEYSYKYMENNSGQFIHSNFTHVMEKIRSMLGSKYAKVKSYFRSLYSENAEFIPFDVFRSAILEFLPEKIFEQEVITLGRHYADVDDQNVPFEDVVSVVQTELKKKNYDDFDNLTLALKAYDVRNTGVMAKDQLYICCRSCSLPISRDMLKLLMARCPKCNGDDINYLDFIRFLDYLKTPVIISAPSPSMRSINWTKVTTAKSMERINYKNFIEDLKTPNC